MSMIHTPSASLTQSLGALEAFGSLMKCVDPAKWETVARPQAAALGDLVLTLHAEVDGALQEMGVKPPQ